MLKRQLCDRGIKRDSFASEITLQTRALIDLELFQYTVHRDDVMLVQFISFSLPPSPKI